MVTATIAINSHKNEHACRRRRAPCKRERDEGKEHPTERLRMRQPETPSAFRAPVPRTSGRFLLPSRAPPSAAGVNQVTAHNDNCRGRPDQDPGRTRLAPRGRRREKTLNNVSLIGRLTRDPELSTTVAGHPVCNVRIAVDGAGSDETLYIDVTSFGAQATACAEHLERGRLVAVAGRLVYREWQARDGSKRSRHKIVGRIEFLPGASAHGDFADGTVEARVAA
jgi:single-strand DNA-binding protein